MVLPRERTKHLFNFREKFTGDDPVTKPLIKLRISWLEFATTLLSVCACAHRWKSTVGILGSNSSLQT